jgi:ribosomal protein S18 acetylase RimI-like enzyme
MEISYKMADLSDLEALLEVSDELFDFPVQKGLTEEFLQDLRHHLAIALDGPAIVGMASAVNYIHPDKEAQLFINEVGVIDAYQQKGIGKQLVRFICNHGRSLGCKEAWVMTETGNKPARKCYLGAEGREDEDPFVMYTFY